MDMQKQAKIDFFKGWLITNDILFLEKANGHFHILDGDGNLFAQVWATTEKMTVQGTDGTYVGMNRIKRVISEKVLEDLITPSVSPSKSVETSKPSEKLEEEEPLCGTYTKRNELRHAFQRIYNTYRGQMQDWLLVMAIYYPEGNTNVITSTSEIETQMRKYLDEYDEHFNLKTDKRIKIVGFMIV